MTPATPSGGSCPTTRAKPLPPLRIPTPFKRKLAKKPVELQGAILECVQKLGENPRSPGLRTSRVRGHQTAWEARVDRGNRVTWEWDDGTIVLRAHCNHEIVRRSP